MCVLGATGDEAFVDAMRQRAIETIRLDAGRDVNPRLVVRLRREIASFRPDVVHTHLVHADVHGQLAARVAGVPAVSSMHGVHRFFTREPVRTIERFALRNARRVIAISEHVAAFLRRHRLAREERIRVVPYGIDAEVWRPRDDEREAARTWYAIPDGEFAVALTSRLIEGKGHRLAFDAVRRARERAPNVTLLVAGAGPLRDDLEDAAFEMAGAVRMLGFVEDIRWLVAACDAVVVPTDPSLGEGFGLAALEAMAAARPVVVTRAGSLPEVAGDAGVVVPPRDARSLADAFVELATDVDQARARGDAAFTRARDAYPLDEMVASTVGVYREALA